MKIEAFELWEPGQVSQKDMADADLVAVPGSGAILETGETLDNSTYIDIPSDGLLGVPIPSRSKRAAMAEATNNGA